MKKIELYKHVILIKDYTATYGNGSKITFKKGLVGLAIHEFKNGEAIMVEISEDEGYEDTLPCFPVELLEYC